MATNIILLPTTAGDLEVTGDPVKADGWYGYSEGLHTIAIYVQNFQGRIHLEASLAMEPTDDDWFPIALSSETAYLEYPKNSSAPIGSMGSGGDTGVESFTFRANIVWLRARLDREYMELDNPDEGDINDLGVIRKIMLSR